MNVNKYIISALVCPFVLGSCADWDDWKYDVEKPQTIAQYEYLNDYAPLKEYLDRNAHPGFKVSAALGVDEFNQQGPLFRLAAHNFDEIVAGNAMKMASCVNDQGVMDFSKVSSFVSAAEDAGLTVYGHTLAWHAQQPSKYLNGLIADKPIPEAPGGGNQYIRYTTDKAGSNPWDNQATCKLATPLEKGGAYTLSMKVKASQDCDLDFWPIWNASPNKNDWGGSNDVQYLPAKKVSTEWTTVTWTFNADFPHDMLQFCFGKLGGSIDFDDVKLVKDGTETNLVANGDFAKDDISAWGNNWQGPSFAIKQGSGTSASGNFCIKYTTTKDGANTWDHQAVYTLPNALKKGAKYVLTMKLKASSATEFAFWPIWDASPNKNEWGGSNDVQYCEAKNLTTDWKTYTWEFTADFTHDKLQFCFGKMKSGESVYMDDITLVKEGTEDNLVANGDFAQNATAGWASNWQGPDFKCEKYGNGIPLTPKEKSDTLTWAMNKWISGMMQATEGKVKAWDLINEAVSGGGNVNGFYALQTEATSEHNPQDFYWQDYFTPEMYGPIVEKAARDAYAAVEGTNPADLKLFINDYNLESDWDSNQKVKSLVYWIGVWEKKGKELGWNTKIDGIGTQMHISYYENEQTRESKKRAIQNMFRIMAATGKLVRISEIDMGYVDKDGKDVTTAQLEKLPIDERVAKEKAMAEHYKWIIEQYFEIVPVNQQYGICQWCLTDSPTNSGWRPGQPVGLWNLNYQRKPAYGGFADGLANKK